ncbi:MAG TPA: SRPBCC family protein [Burkholderiaceae bacterium]
MLTVLLVIVVAVVALVAYASTRPDTFRIERSIRIGAPIIQVAELIDDFRAWSQWSPWEHIDPTMQRRYGGADTGVGAVYEWEGTGKVGAGRMEVTEMRAGPEGGLISIKLDFLKPFKASNTAQFLLKPTDSGTDLTWAMFGPSPFMSKLMGVFMDMDKMVGRDFEAGLESLKKTAEAAAKGS